MVSRPTPNAATARALAPDLARGLMLLLIAIAHAPEFIAAPSAGLSVSDSAGEFVKSFVADNQGRPMFVLLFGYGLGQLARREHDRGGDWPSIRKLFRRRGFWLVVIGFVHAVFLAPVDIISMYGLALLLLAPMARARDSMLLWTVAVTFVPATLAMAWFSEIARTAGAGGGQANVATDMATGYGRHVVSGLVAWPFSVLLGILLVVPGMVLGLWAARRRILDEPRRHRRLLSRVAVSALGVALVGRLPMALIDAAVWAPSVHTVQAATVAHIVTGYVGGIGLAAAVGLIAIKIGSSRGRFTTAFVALGQRSLTFYLFQSAVWLVLFYPFTLGLWDEVGTAGAVGIAVATWLLSVVLAEGLRRGGYRGPTEVLLRRLAYGRPKAGAR
ncbi:DUF418 domain-containing protein [Amycolatopsis lurida]